MKNRQVFSQATQTQNEMEKPRCDFTRAMWCNADENDLSLWVWVGKEKYYCAADSARAQEAIWFEDQNALLIEWPDGVPPEPKPEADPEPEAVTDEAPTADDEPIVQAVALSFEEITNGGIMFVEDELIIRRGLAWASVSDHADALVAAIIDPNRRTELIAQVAMAANKRQLGLQLDEADIEAESRFVALQAREDEIRRFERQMREAVRFASVDMLRDFDAEGAGWPT